MKYISLTCKQEIRSITWLTTVVDKHVVGHITRFTFVHDFAVVDITALGFVITQIFEINPLSRIIFLKL